MSANLTRHYQAARDTALRSRSGAFSYLIIFAIIAFFTPYFDQHPVVVSLAGLAITLATTLRAVCAFAFDRFYSYSPRAWYAGMLVGNVGLAFAWSVLSAMSIYYFGWQWTTMLTLLSAAAFSAGAVTVFSIDRLLVFGHLSAMFFPTLFAMAFLYTQESLTSLFLFAFYFLFLLHAAQRLHGEYWNALDNVALLDDRAKELELKNAELESFAYSVSHDLRTPLRALDGYSQILLEESAEKLSPEEKNHLDRIRQAAQHMGRIIDDLLRLSRISRLSIQPAEVNLSELVRVNAEKLQQLDPSRNVTVEIEPDVVASGDKSLLALAIENLLSNAWKYSRNSEHPKIRFAQTQVGGKPVYYIKDNGVGFDVAQSHSLFKAFHRLHSNDEFPGIGVGLATVKRVFQRHGGNVWANAKVGKGATFYFSLENPNGPELT